MHMQQTCTKQCRGNATEIVTSPRDGTTKQTNRKVGVRDMQNTRNAHRTAYNATRDQQKRNTQPTSCWKAPDSMYVTVCIPRCGCVGKPAGGVTRNSSRSKKGSRSGRAREPMLRRTRAPSPSACSRAITTREIVRPAPAGAAAEAIRTGIDKRVG